MPHPSDMAKILELIAEVAVLGVRMKCDDVPELVDLKSRLDFQLPQKKKKKILINRKLKQTISGLIRIPLLI